ncbi:MAG: heat-inducible transcriptional repressor HrcA [Halanaerobiaceae bacterium]
MVVENIEKRKRNILRAIIREHILTAEPIGSRTLAKTYEFGVSSATIRNEMADLEDMGYLTQPHTSAGRIPSDKGYRYYVDVLMEQEGIPEHLQKSLSRFYNEKKGVKGIISNMVKMLSKMTKYTTMISEPQLQKSKIRNLQLIKVAKRSLLIVLITDTGIVNNKIINLKQELTSRQLRYINRYLVSKLQGKELTSIDEDFINQIEAELIKQINFSQTKEMFDILYEELSGITKSGDLRIYLGGTSYILEQPEFNDMETLKKVLNILEQEEILRELIDDASNEDIKVKIGHENQLKEMEKCSIVIATYYLGDRAIGKIGVLGPTRMEYPRVISTVDLAADVLGKIISKVSR